MTEKNLITKGEAASRARVTMRSIDNWLHTGKLTKHVNGLGQVRIDADELDRQMTFVPVTPAVVSSDR